MRKIFCLFGVFILSGMALLRAQHPTPSAYGGSQINYVRTWQATAPGQTAATMLTGPLTDVKQTTQYYDGLGRSVQTVAKQASPLGNDMVAAHWYDASGKESYKYLGFTANVATAGDLTTDGTFKGDAFQQQQSFYNTTYSSPGSTDASWPYSQIDYEASPQNRILDSYAPGTNWAGSSSASTPHRVKQQFTLNPAADNVQMWTINAAQGSIPTSAGAYGAGQLYKTIGTDEQGRQNITYKDTYGQVVLKKVQNTAAADNGTSTGSVHNGWLCTYYVYDDYGNLRFLIPPAVVAQIDGSWSISQTVADELCYRYEYDNLNRVIIRKTPGTPSGSVGEVWMVYDMRNRLVMTQDGNMRTNNQWLCYLYDALDRETMTGTITYSGTLSQLQQLVTTQTTGNSSGTVSGATPPTIQGNVMLSSESMSGDWQASQSVSLNTGFSSATGGSFTAEIVVQTATPVSNTVVVNNNPIPAGSTLSPLTTTFYDNYNWLSTAGVSLSSALDQTYTQNSSYFITSYYSAPTYAAPIVQSSQTRGLATGRMVQVMDVTPQNLYSLNVYDDRGRMIQSQRMNITGGKDIATTQYDWSGKVQRTLLSHVKSNTNPQTHLVATAMTYDVMGRLQSVVKTLNSTFNGTALNTPTTTIVTEQYDELGRLKQATLGNNLETLQYDYNIRGWLLGMNRNFAKTTSVNANFFGYDLGYDKGAILNSGGTQIGNYAVPVYDGQISGVVWRSKGDNQQRKYDYTYDPVDRLAAADFNQVTGGAFNKTAGLDFSVSNLFYDGNGNMTSMYQNGWLLGGSQQIDKLTYNYMNSNNSDRLLNVQDNSAYNGSNPASTLGDIHYAGTKSVTATDYAYDNNGNATSDANRAISTMSFNFLNLPSLITIANSKGIIRYVYDAAGSKIKKTVTENNGSVAYNGTAYPTSVTTVTEYIGDFVYKSLSYSNPALASLQYTDQLQYVGDEEGRIRPVYSNPATLGTPTGYAFDYFIRDHLNNVRMVLTDEVQKDIYPAATMEDNTIATEQTFYNITNDVSHVVATSGLTWWPGSSGNGSYPDNNGIANPGDPTPNATSAKVYKLNGQTGDKYGLGITIKVMAGDLISIFGKSVWHNTGATAGSFPITSVLSSFINSFAGTSAVAAGGHGAVTGATLNGASATTSGLTTLLNGTPNQPNPTTVPKAAINWILFNDQFVPVSVGTSLVSATSDVVYTHPISLNMPMASNGYLYVYCSNESDIDVYFDNLQVTNTRGPILEETHYYPVGLAMAGISDKAWNKLANYYHYQGSELQDQEFSDGTGLADYDFQTRYYDQQLGVWHNPDGASQFSSPYVGMGNNWPNGRDPNGQIFGLDDLIVSLVGFAVDYVSYGLTKGEWGGKALLAGLTGAVEAELAYVTLGGGGGLSNLFSSTASGGSMSAALVFSGTFAVGAGLDISQNAQQIHDTKGWGAYGLIAGYSAAAALQAGFQSNDDNAIASSIDKGLGVDKISLLNMGGNSSILNNAIGYGIGGMINNVGSAALGAYDPATNSWKALDWKLISPVLASSFTASVVNQIVGNTVQNFGAYMLGGSQNGPIEKLGAKVGAMISWPFKEVLAQWSNQITTNLMTGKTGLYDLFSSSNTWNEGNSLWNDIIHGP